MLRLFSCDRFPTNWGAVLFHGLIFFHLSCTLPQIRVCHAFAHHRAAADVVDGVSGELVMSRSFADRQKTKKSARFQFELLEPRHLFSVNPLSPSSPEAPPVESTSAAPLLGEQADQALTNFIWLPFVSAGVDKVATVSTSLFLQGEYWANAYTNFSLAWTKISGPGNVVFGNAAAEGSAVTFDQAGTYELQLAATNGGLTSFDRVFVTVAASNTINIDQAWLDNPANQGTVNGRTVYILKQAGKTFALQTDVSTKGTAFYIANKDITFDLNGHTITYNTDKLAGPNAGDDKSATHGVVLYLGYHNTEIPTIAGAAEAFNVAIKNGTIKNDGAGNLSHGIFGQRGNGALIENIEIETNGKDSHTVFFKYGGTNGVTLRDNLLTTHTDSSFNRHAGPANVMVGGKLVAERNVLIGGNSGFNVLADSVINENVIGHTGFATNGYGVWLYRTSNVTITNNLILPTNGRGVLFNAGENMTVTGNVILHLEESNAEFGDNLNPPAVRSRYETKGINYSDNISLGIGGGGYTSASSLYISSYGSGASTYANNDATTILVGTPDISHYAQPITLEGTGGSIAGGAGGSLGVDLIKDNNFKSNHVLVRVEGYDGYTEQSEPLKGNSFDWVTGNAAYGDFMAAIESKLSDLGLGSNALAAAQTYIGGIDTLIDGLISGQGLQEGRAVWQTKYFSHVGTTTFADLIDSDWGNGVDPKSYTYAYSNLSSGAVKVREGFTQQVKILNGSTPLANSAVSVTTAQGDSYQATTDANGLATLTFYRFSIEKADAAGAAFSVIDRTQSTITAGGKSIVVNHSSVPSQINIAGPGVQSIDEQTEGSEVGKQSNNLQIQSPLQAPPQPQQLSVNQQSQATSQLEYANDIVFEDIGSAGDVASQIEIIGQPAILPADSSDEKSRRNARRLRSQASDAHFQESGELTLALLGEIDSLASSWAQIQRAL